MRQLARLLTTARSIRQAASASLAVFLRDTGHGMLEVSHSSLALVGLLLVSVVLIVLVLVLV